MIVVSIDHIPGHDFEVLGMVQGAMVQTVHMGKDIFNGLKTLVGGELTSYTEMMNSSRATAISRMISNANQIGADAIINVRYASSQVMQGAAEVLAYGTAVKFIN
ncbi:MAG: YbjQ family protein [Lachnospiraceae bacterium]|nr:YbjQ family protein [Lachnospiraceae bacterium]